MFARYLLPLCLFALFAIAVHADEAVEQHDGVAVPEGAGTSLAVKTVAKIIASIFATAATGCLMEAAVHCKQDWKNPKAAFDCGKQFLKDNQGRCVTGK